MKTEVVIADYKNQQHAVDIINLLDAYASGSAGGGKSLGDSVRSNLVRELAAFPGAFSILCYADDISAGLANCFMGFSTFKCKPLVNIHDIVVAEPFRGKGLSQVLLQKLEDVARQRGCCKLTLEVLTGNTVAKNAYSKFGFMAYELDPALGQAMFWEKQL